MLGKILNNLFLFALLFIHIVCFVIIYTSSKPENEWVIFIPIFFAFITLVAIARELYAN